MKLIIIIVVNGNGLWIEENRKWEKELMFIVIVFVVIC